MGFAEKVSLSRAGSRAQATPVVPNPANGVEHDLARPREGGDERLDDGDRLLRRVTGVAAVGPALHVRQR